MIPTTSRLFIRLSATVLAVGVMATGCGGPPQVAPSNYRLIEGLRTAVSSRRSDWLERTAKLVADRHSAGELTDEQSAAFQEIIDEARRGEWAEAESRAIQFSKAQRPASSEQDRPQPPVKAPSRSKR